jgi:hypothetical protein
VRQTQGSTTDLLRSAESPKGKALNALDFPFVDVGHPSTSLASDVVAWNEMLERMESVEYPTRWGLAATAGAYDRFHVAPNGLGTTIEVKTGAKWWVVARPQKLPQFAKLARVSELVNIVGDIDQLPKDWILEAILLTKGTALQVFVLLYAIQLMNV